MPASDSLKKLVRTLATKGPLKTLPTTKRVRILFNGTFVADTTSALYVWEHEHYPQLYLPMVSFINVPGFDVKLGYGEAIKDDTGHIVGGEVSIAVRRLNTKADFEILEDMVLFAADLDGPAEVLRDYVKVEFDAVDQWFEEDNPIHVHPKDPFKRIDTISSLRPIRITLDGHTLAEATSSVHLYETGLPARYYLPYTSLNTMYVHDSETISECPYKGIANYQNIVIGEKTYEDLVWWYALPTSECLSITGMRCFFNEKVDIWLKDKSDGKGEWKKQTRPKTHFA